MNLKKVAAIVLAGGKGTRINAQTINKTMMAIAGKPMVAYTVGNLEKLKLVQIILVVGYAKKSVTLYFEDRVDYAFQAKRLGTAHAIKISLSKIKKDVEYVLVTYGDDSAFYTLDVFQRLIKKCQKPGTAFTLLTLKKKEPTGLGRIMRDRQGRLIGIVEEKNATRAQKTIKEINAGTYCLKKRFLEKYLKKIKKDKKSGEYYLTDIVDLAVRNGLKVETVPLPSEAYWHGVNTKEQLLAADEKMRRKLCKKTK